MKIFAHRGYSAKYPENSLQAFRAAVDLRADMLELDVHLTKDRKLIVTHDYSLKRLFNLDKTVEDLTQLELKDLGLPSLKCVLQEFPQQPINIEVKKETLHAEEDYLKIIHEFERIELHSHHLISSFDHDLLGHIYNAGLKIKLGFLHCDSHQEMFIEKAKQCHAHSYNVSLTLISKKEADLIHSHGMKIYVYTCNTEEAFQKCLDAGADGLFTDELELAQNFFA